MKEVAEKWTILGQGLAGTCLAWALWERQQDFLIIDCGIGGSSRVAAGMVNPITGKNFEPSWRISEFLPEALAFYKSVENILGCRVWYPLPVLRLAATEREWNKIISKLASPEAAPWVTGEVTAPVGWVGAVELRGGGRLDTRSFLDGSREFFNSIGRYEKLDASPARAICCDGASGLMTGRYGSHRCAKGEILTVRASDWDEQRIRIGAGGWLVPQGSGIFKVGSTYEWGELNEVPTPSGRLAVEAIAGRLGGHAFEVIAHEAAIRPILRRSQPLIGPTTDGGWMFNALGSKGSLYAPGIARRLADWLVDGKVPEPAVDIRVFLNNTFQP